MNMPFDLNVQYKIECFKAFIQDRCFKVDHKFITVSTRLLPDLVKHDGAIHRTQIHTSSLSYGVDLIRQCSGCQGN